QRDQSRPLNFTTHISTGRPLSVDSSAEDDDVFLMVTDRQMRGRAEVVLTLLTELRCVRSTAGVVLLQASYADLLSTGERQAVDLRHATTQQAFIHKTRTLWIAPKAITCQQCRCHRK
ncbi:hypothetical protein IRJ41_016988, partial [Triplophysa rosa]